MARTRIDRAGADDAMALATDVGPAPMQVGACIVVEGGAGLEVARIRALVGDRIRSVPRLRQRLHPTPLGCGRPVWVDDPAFRIDDHFGVVACPDPGDLDSLLDVAADVVTTPLPRDRPLWCARWVTGAAEGRAGLVVVFHHVLADGIGGLAVLANLVDGAEVSPVEDPHPFPSTFALWADAWWARVVTLGRSRQAISRLVTAGRELRAAPARRAAPCSVLAPTGARRRFGVVDTDLGDVLDAAHAGGATVNDVVLVAVAGALGAVLRTRGETLDELVVSMPISARRSTVATELGNRVGAVPVAVPVTGPGDERLAITAGATAVARDLPRGGSSALITPAFRCLAALGLFRWFIERQRLVHTFVTNLRGPPEQLFLAGAPVGRIIPLTVVAGNVTVAFAVLSYAGRLGITVVCDPDHWPDADRLVDQLEGQLDALMADRPDGRSAPPPRRRSIRPPGRR